VFSECYKRVEALETRINIQGMQACSRGAADHVDGGHIDAACEDVRGNEHLYVCVWCMHVQECVYACASVCVCVCVCVCV
jgi:hypothetical protein